MFYVYCGLALIAILATALLAHVVLNFTHDDPSVQTSRSRKVEFLMLGLMIAVCGALIALIHSTYGA